jgi:hypothetical protein
MMRRVTTRATATTSGALLLAAMLLVPAPATSGDPLCHGQVATVVGTPGQPLLTATDGPDVIITGGAVAVSALGGDDLVCVTGGTVDVDAGIGDDTVDASARTGDGGTVLGDGADEFLGGPGFDEVETGGFDSTDSFEDGHPDVVDTGVGGASVRSGVSWETNDDELVLGGPGGETDVNTVSIAGRQVPDGSLHFDDGRAVLRVQEASSGVGDWLVDNRERRITTGPITWLTWTGNVSELDVELLEIPGGEGTEMAFRGTRRAEIFHVDGEVSRLDARFGRGADSVVLPNCAGFTGSLVALGPGHDTARSWCNELVVRLDRGRLQRGLAVRDLESLVVRGNRVSVWGDDAANRIELDGCGGTVHSGAGDDAVRVVRRLCGGLGASLYGGRGDDMLSGALFADLLVGDRGRDVVDGKGGTDRCRAEVEFNCETS